jgi:hypothetical protein
MMRPPKPQYHDEHGECSTPQQGPALLCVGKRCLACKSPWMACGERASTDSRCPFCGSKNTVTIEEAT